VKFLVDANLPPALAQWLAAEGHEAQHVADLGMEAMPDREIWKHARDSDACIVTKDEDFVLLQALDRAGPPLSGFVLATRSGAFLCAACPWYGPR
jgi:predicted nuclease of predicted toxin-antitoxin system